MKKSILYCTSHMTKEACKDKLIELREKIKTGVDHYSEYKNASLVDKIMDYDMNGNLRQYNRIRLYYKS